MRFLSLGLLVLPFAIACGSSDDSAGGAGGAAPISLRQADGTCDPTGTWDFKITGGGVYPSCAPTQLFLNGVTFSRTSSGSIATSTDGFLTATNPTSPTIVLAPDGCSIDISLAEAVDPTMDDGAELDVTVTMDLSQTPSTGHYSFEAPEDCGDQEFDIDLIRRPQ